MSTQAIAANRLWSDFFARIESGVRMSDDPLTPQAREVLMALKANRFLSEDQCLHQLEAWCVRACGGDVARAKKLTVDAIYWSAP